jgi:hypothetical protein
MRKCIETWKTGARSPIKFIGEDYADVYDGHVTNLVNYLRDPTSGPYLRIYMNELGKHAQ